MAHRATVGNVTLLSFSDAIVEAFDLADVFPSVSRDSWRSYPETATADGKFRTNMGNFLLRSQGLTIMVDTGVGPRSLEGLSRDGGSLMTELERIGVGPDEIDVVVFTHLHGDHIGWNVIWETDKPRLTFPKARYLIPRIDWEHFTSPPQRRQNSAINTMVMPLEGLGALELVNDGHEITSEVTLVATPGHTPGHTSIALASGGERGFILGDVLNAPSQVEHPEWRVSFDTDPAMAERTRTLVLDRLEREQSLVGAGHFLPPSFGHVLRSEGLFRWKGI